MDFGGLNAVSAGITIDTRGAIWDITDFQVGVVHGVNAGSGEFAAALYTAPGGALLADLGTFEAPAVPSIADPPPLVDIPIETPYELTGSAFLALSPATASSRVLWEGGNIYWTGLTSPLYTEWYAPGTYQTSQTVPIFAVLGTDPPATSPGVALPEPRYMAVAAGLLIWSLKKKRKHGKRTHAT